MKVVHQVQLISVKSKLETFQENEKMSGFPFKGTNVKITHLVVTLTFPAKTAPSQRWFVHVRKIQPQGTIDVLSDTVPLTANGQACGGPPGKIE